MSSFDNKKNLEMTGLVSIVLPTYNREKVLRRALSSVSRQTYKNWELIVIDNKSSDSTKALVESYADPRFIFKEIANDGVIAKSRNEAIKLASGSYIAFLDSDDWWESEKLDKCVSHLNNGFDFVYHDLKIHYEEPKSTQMKKFMLAGNLKKPVFLDLLFNGNQIPTSSVVTRRHLLEAIGGFSEEKNLVSVEDYDAWLRIAKITDRFLRIKKYLGFYNVGHSNLSASDLCKGGERQILIKYSKDLKANGQEVAPWFRWAQLKKGFGQTDSQSRLVFVVFSYFREINKLGFSFLSKKLFQVFCHFLSRFFKPSQ